MSFAQLSQPYTANPSSYHGAATHYLHSSSLPDLENRLAELTFKDYATVKERCDIINSTIEEFVTGLPHDQPMTLAGPVRNAIDECFAADQMEEVISRVEGLKDDPKLKHFANKTLSRLSTRSPTSLKVTLKQMQLGSSWSIADAFDREYNIASVFMAKPDFVEGVTAKLIKKPPEKPTWQPASLDEVTWEEVDSYFANPEGQERLQLLKTGLGTAYMDYPHAYGLPTEAAVEKFVNENKGLSKGAIIDRFLMQTMGKLGVRERLNDILERKVSVKDKELVWEDVQQYRPSQGSRDPARS